MDQLELLHAPNPGEVIPPVEEAEEQVNPQCCVYNEHFPEDELHSHYDLLYCDECESENFDFCAHCATAEPSGELNYCEDTSEDFCSRYICRDRYIYHEGSWYSQDYYSETFEECNGCGYVARQSSGVINYYDSIGESRCDDCAPTDDCDDDDECGEISSYGQTHGLPFFGNPADRIFFGAELEVEVEGFRDPAASLAKDFLGRDFIETKHDGSLSNGFEIVTAPADLASHRARWAKFFDNIEDFRPHKMKSWNTKTCGMHVHVSRRPLTQLQIGKIVEFIHNPANYSLVRKIAGRHSDNYGGYNTERKIKDVKRSGERYTAINLTNFATIEFRLFKGTLLKAGFFRNLEFVHALVNYTKPAARSIPESVNGQLFCKWLLTPGVKENYPNLIAYLADRNFLTLPAKKVRPELNTLNTTEVCA